MPRHALSYTCAAARHPSTHSVTAEASSCSQAARSSPTSSRSRRAVAACAHCSLRVAISAPCDRPNGGDPKRTTLTCPSDPTGRPPSDPPTAAVASSIRVASARGGGGEVGRPNLWSTTKTSRPPISPQLAGHTGDAATGSRSASMTAAARARAVSPIAGSAPTETTTRYRGPMLRSSHTAAHASRPSANHQIASQPNSRRSAAAAAAQSAAGTAACSGGGGASWIQNSVLSLRAFRRRRDAA